MLGGLVAMGVSGFPEQEPGFPQPEVAPGLSWSYDVIGTPLMSLGPNAAAWHPDGRLLAISNGIVETHFELWDVEARKRVWAFDKSGAPSSKSLTFTKDGKYLIISSADKRGEDGRIALSLLDAETAQVAGHILAPPSLPRPSYASDWVLSPDGKRLVAGYVRGMSFFGVYDTATWELLRTTPRLSWGRGVSFAFDPSSGHVRVSSAPPEYNNHDQDLRRWAASHDQPGVATWNIETGDLVAFQRLEGSGNDLNFLLASLPQDAVLVGAGLGPEKASGKWVAGAWNPISGKRIKLFDDSIERVLELAVSRDGTLVAAACMGAHLRIWDYLTGKQLLSHIWRKGGHWLDVTVLAFHPRDNRFAFNLKNRICVGQLQPS